MPFNNSKENFMIQDRKNEPEKERKQSWGIEYHYGQKSRNVGPVCWDVNVGHLHGL